MSKDEFLEEIKYVGIEIPSDEIEYVVERCAGASIESGVHTVKENVTIEYNGKSKIYIMFDGMRGASFPNDFIDDFKKGFYA